MHRRIYTCFRLYHYEINFILIPMSMPANYRHFPRQKVNHGKFIINFTSSKVYDSRAFLVPKISRYFVRSPGEIYEISRFCPKPFCMLYENVQCNRDFVKMKLENCLFAIRNNLLFSISKK